MPELELSKKSFLSIFKIKTGELQGFLFMLIHAFLSGLGIALAFTAINILIIDYHAVHDIPKLYIYTALLLLISGYVYSKVEHRYQPKSVFRGVLIVISIWAILTSVKMSMAESVLVVTIAFCTYYLIYYLSNLEYWGAASLMFNVRQGKRLFGLLSVGESLAKITGYALTPFIITKLSVAWVFIIIAICFGSSFIIFYILSTKYNDVFKVNHHHHEESEKKSAKLTNLSINQILKIDDFSKFISVFAMLSTLTYFLFNYAFLLKVEERFMDLEEVAIFFASLFSIAKLLNLVIKTFFASRMLQYLGLRYILILLPISILIVIIMGISLVYFGQFENNIFIWIFTIIILLDEVMRSSLYTPSYLILFQPLPKNKRLEGHTLSKGIMEPLGIGLAGVVIVILVYLDKFDLELLSFIILAAILAWIFSGIKVFRAYINILQDALKTKLLSRGSFELSKDELQLLKETKLNSHDPLEKFYALQMLSSSMDKEEIKSHVLDLFKNDDPYIIKSSFKLCESNGISGLQDAIAPFMHHRDEELAQMACYEYARLMQEDGIELLKKNLETDNPKHKNAIIGAAIKYGGLPGAIEFGRELLNLIDSDDDKERTEGAYIIGSIANENYYSPLIKLHADDSAEVRQAAIIASGQIRNTSLIPYIFKARNDRTLQRYCKESLAKFGGHATQFIQEEFGKIGVYDDIKLLRLMENHRSHGTTQYYYELLNHQNFDLKNEVVNILYKRSYFQKKDRKQYIVKLQNNTLASISKLLKFIGQTHSLELEKLIYNELYNIQLSCLYKSLSFVYARKSVNEIINNSYILDGEYRLNAIELLENTLLPKDTRKIISPIEKIFEYQSGNKSDNWDMKDHDIIHAVIQDGNNNYSSWLLANCIRLAKLRGLVITFSDSLLNTDIPIIKQEIDRFNHLNKMQN